MICVDASVAAKWVLPEPHSDKALALFEATTNLGQSVIAPPLLRFEVTNIIRRRMVVEHMPLSDANRILLRFLAFPVELQLPPDLHPQALGLADAHGLPAAYDAHYLALAMQHGCDDWTDDQRLLRTVSGQLPFVRWIGDFTPAAS